MEPLPIRSGKVSYKANERFERRRAKPVLEWLKRLLKGSGPRQTGMITRTCKRCGKTFTLPEEVQHWPDCCQECRAKHQPEERIARTCRGCGRRFTFVPSAGQWPRYCPECQAKRKGNATR